MGAADVQLEGLRMICEPSGHFLELLGILAENAHDHRIILQGRKLLDKILRWVGQAHGVEDTALRPDQAGAVVAGVRLRADGLRDHAAGPKFQEPLERGAGGPEHPGREEEMVAQGYPANVDLARLKGYHPEEIAVIYY